MDDPILIRVKNLTKLFPMGNVTVRALDGVDMEIRRGSFTVVMGPSGSGKSTLLYLLGGLDRPTSGEIHVNCASLESMDENALGVYRRRSVGFIFQSFNLVASMNALENVTFPMRFAGVLSRERQKRGMELLTRVGLEKRAHHKPTELSGGQQQRVAIARALVNDPPLILADEPTGNLDTHSGYSIMQMLSELHKQGKTIFVVTHDARMTAFATDIVRLLDGRIVDQSAYDAAVLVPAPESNA
ncbi:MAG: ABC transporter ATP-binding protein [Anaerolineaceae bacterium]